jgi:hypothetical protein
MAQIFALIKLLIAIGPGIIAMIVELEKLFPESGQGSVKLALIKAYVQKAFDFAGTALPSFEGIWPKIAEIISVAVSIFNSSGLFAAKEEV